MSQINKKDIISDEALEAPLVLRKNFESLLGTAKEFISAAKEYDDKLKSSSKTSEDHRNRTKELSDAQRVLAQITKQVATESAKQSDEYQKLSAKLREVKEANRDKMKMDADEARLVEAKSSSIERLSQALTRNKQEYAKLGSEHERASSKGRHLLKTIQEQDEALRRLTPAAEKAEGHIFLLSEALEKMGEGGVRVNEMLIHTAEAFTSGWSLVVGGIGLAAAALKIFFENSEEGVTRFEIAEAQMATRWDIFKNKIAAATQAVIEFAEADEKTRKYHEEQRVARMTPEQKKQYDIEQAALKASADLVREKVKLDEHEAEIGVEIVGQKAEAAKLEVEARESADRSIKERLEAIQKADTLYKQIYETENDLAAKRAGLANSEIYLHAQGRELLVSERLEITNNIKAVAQLAVQYEQAARRRTAYIAGLKKDLDKENSYKPDFSLYEKDYQDMLNAIGKLNNEDEKSQKEKDAEELKQQKETDEALFEMQERDQEEMVRKALERWDRYIERKKEKAQKEKELAANVAEASVEIVNAQFEHQIKAHEFYLGQVRENYQEEMQMAEGNKIAQAQLTSQFREKEKREEQEMIKLKRRQAQFDRDAAALNIVLKTAEAVMSDVAKYPETAGQPFAAFDEAIGAAQMLAIMAKPLPSYDVGTQNHPGGAALVHPFELMWTPDGGVAMTPNSPTVMELPKGTEVSTTDETIRMLALAGLMNSMSFERSASNPNNQVIKELREVKQAIENKPEPNFHAMMAGYYAFKQESETFQRKIMVEKFGRR